jgi:hypothetical protein
MEYTNIPLMPAMHHVSGREQLIKLLIRNQQDMQAFKSMLLHMLMYLFSSACPGV